MKGSGPRRLDSRFGLRIKGLDLGIDGSGLRFRIRKVSFLTLNPKP